MLGFALPFTLSLSKHNYLYSYLHGKDNAFTSSFSMSHHLSRKQILNLEMQLQNINNSLIMLISWTIFHAVFTEAIRSGNGRMVCSLGCKKTCYNPNMKSASKEYLLSSLLDKYWCTNYKRVGILRCYIILYMNLNILHKSHGGMYTFCWHILWFYTKV